MNTILITGANGQIGRELVPALGRSHPKTHLLGAGRTQLVFPSGRPLNPKQTEHIQYQALPSPNFSYEVLDVRDMERLRSLVQAYNVDTIYHLASLLSAKGEKMPSLCWEINVKGLKNILDVAKEFHLKVFWPSSIAVFGNRTPKQLTPQEAVTDPSTLYGISKVTGELLCEYYSRTFQLDVRGLRLPGIISSQARPGGGTTDYAVDMFYDAILYRTFDCFVKADTRLPFMYMPDTVRAILKIMEIPCSQLDQYVSYNLTAFSPSAAELVVEIQTHLPDFVCHYAPDERQAIANSWPESIDDTQARQDWGWQPEYDLSTMVQDMIEHLSRRYRNVDQNSTPLPINP